MPDQSEEDNGLGRGMTALDDETAHLSSVKNKNGGVILD